MNDYKTFNIYNTAIILLSVIDGKSKVFVCFWDITAGWGREKKKF